MFYEFNQNNSGGNFHFNEDEGITHIVVIEAKSSDEAVARAEYIGLYFDGCNSGDDCPCCGDRWYYPYGEGDEVPSTYEEPLTKDTFRLDSLGRYMEEGREACVHYLDGRKEWF